MNQPSRGRSQQNISCCLCKKQNKKQNSPRFITLVLTDYTQSEGVKRHFVSGPMRSPEEAEPKADISDLQ